jgi:hypothetical protein
METAASLLPLPVSPAVLPITYNMDDVGEGGRKEMDSMAEQSQRSGEQALMERNPTRITAEPGKQELIIVREFDAPRDLVFRAYTDPELFKRWIGPRGYTTRIEAFEARSGGSWRYVQTDKDGNEYGFHGVNHDVTPPERIIQTFEYEGLPESGHVSPRGGEVRGASRQPDTVHRPVGLPLGGGPRRDGAVRYGGGLEGLILKARRAPGEAAEVDVGR